MNSKEYRQYELDSDEYQELKWFCWQYQKKKAEAAQLRGPASPSLSGLRNTHNGNVSESKALKAARLSSETDLIDKALELAADESLRSFLKKNVTQHGMPYEKLGCVPTGRRQFYETRRKFFCILKMLKDKAK